MVSERETLTRRIRVLRVITRLNIGGPALHVGILAREMDPSRFEQVVVAGREGPSEGSMLELGRAPAPSGLVRVASLGRTVSPLDDLRALMEVTRTARRFRPDIVHTHLAKAGLIGRVAGRLAGARAVIHTYHGTVFRGHFGPAVSAAVLTAERALGRITDRVVAITEGQRADLVSLGVARPERVVVIPLGLDLVPLLAPVERGEARRALGIDGDGPLVGIVARLVPVKDVASFIRAFAIVAGRVPGARAAIVGDGEQRQALERLARDLGVASRCTFAGWRSDMTAVYSAMDVVVLSSLSEGSPVSVIEAMAAGRAVVATRVGGVPDVVRHGESGLLVPPADAAALADAIVALLADPALRRAIGDAARSAAYPRFDARRLVRDIQALYATLLPECGDEADTPA